MKNARRIRDAAVLCWILHMLSPSAALAQLLGKTVVVTLGADREPALAAAQELEAQLAERRVTLISMHDARDRFAERSRPPQRPSETDLESLARQAAQAVEHVAFGRAQAAERAVHNIVALAERSLETLNRETSHARQLLDACLALVRSSVHDGQRELAIEQAMECRRLVPDLSPNESSHPGSVIGALAEADDRIRRMHAGNLSVRTQPAQICSLYLNGRHLGTTPFVTDRAAAGVYRVHALPVSAATERCDGVDNDCDGETDESDAIDAIAWYADCDGDGFAPSAAQPVRRCAKPTASSNTCSAWTDRSSATPATTDCNDSSAAHHPGASYDFPFTPEAAPSAPAEYDLNCDGSPEIDPNNYVAFDLGSGKSTLGPCGGGTGCCIYAISTVITQCGAGATADIDCGDYRAEGHPVWYRCR